MKPPGEPLEVEVGDRVETALDEVLSEGVGTGEVVVTKDAEIVALADDETLARADMLLFPESVRLARAEALLELTGPTVSALGVDELELDMDGVAVALDVAAASARPPAGVSRSLRPVAGGD